MSGVTRLKEKWINRGLWMIAVIFASFLIGLGSLIVEDLPRVQTAPTIDQFMDPQVSGDLKFRIEQKEKTILLVTEERNKESEKLAQLERDYLKSKEVFNNWVSSRQSTQDTEQNSEVLRRTKELEEEQKGMRVQEARVQEKDQEIARLQDDVQPDRTELSKLEAAAFEKVESEVQKNQLKVFLFRLALTLPLLLLAGWLFVRKRKTQQWPFVWGFVFFALFTFFIELVPYLPSYGGYVRYAVGIIVTYVIGRYSIRALNDYLEKQRLAEALPTKDMKEVVNYDLAQQRLSKDICPGCERPIDTKDPTKNFCIHCGTCVFNTCQVCQARKNSFAKFCHSCGAAG